MAVESVGWPADAASKMLWDDNNPTSFAKRATAYGKTLLHWAAAHFGQWLSIMPGHRSEQSWQIYSKLASELISMGADTHALCHNWTGALDLQQLDPFLCFLKGVNLDRSTCWGRPRIDRAARQWGKMLVEGGLQLSDYVPVENDFLRSLKWIDIRLATAGTAGEPFVPTKLLITKDAMLAVETTDFLCKSVWKAQAMSIPGTWPTSPTLPNTIVWHPRKKDHCYGFRWVLSDRIYIKPGLARTHVLCLSDAPSELYDWIADSPLHTWPEESQDDHSLVARFLGQPKQPRQRMRWESSHRRALSTPPILESSRTSQFGRGARPLKTKSVFLPSGPELVIHKCPFDLRWRRCPLNLYNRHSWDFCLHGRCDELEVSDDREYLRSFEGWFLSNEDYAHVAKRYAEKFCPERLHLAEATVERVTQRTQLAMGPKRSEDVDVRTG